MDTNTHTWDYQPRMTNTSWTVKKQKQIPWTPGQKQQVTYELEDQT